MMAIAHHGEISFKAFTTSSWLLEINCPEHQLWTRYL
jgi:hypothetical protein